MLRHCYLLVLFLFVAGLGSARAQSFAWAKVARVASDTSSTSGAVKSATDLNGNTYVYGMYQDSVTVGSTTFKSSGTMSAIIIKYDSTGTVLWAKNLNGIFVTSIAADNGAGGVFTTGEQFPSTGAVTWDGAPFPSSTSSSFYAKCSASGALQWAQPLPINTGGSVVAADAGNAYLQSFTYTNVTVGGVSVNANSHYILKINSGGTTQWVQTLHLGAGNGFYFGGIRLGAKPGGGFLLSISISAGATLLLGPGTGTPLLTSAATNDELLINFDASGTPLWTIVMGAWSRSATTGAIVADAMGNCYVTGYAPNGIQVGSVALGPSYFLAKFNASGTMLWARGEQQGTTGLYNGSFILVANSQGVTALVVVQNPINNPVTLGPLTLRSYSNIVHYSPQGDEQWAVSDSRTDYGTSAPISGFYTIRGLGIDSRGNLYTAGAPGTRLYRAGTVGNPPVLQLGTQTTVGRGIVVCRINASANTLRGQVYLDQNGNGQQDASEQMFPRPLTGILTQGGATSYSAVGADGVLQAYAVAGAYTLSLGSLLHYTVTQPSNGSYAGAFSGNNQLIASQNFGLAPIANQADIRATLTPYGAARPGFTTRYRLTVENVGTTTVASGTATMTLDSRMAYISSTPNGSRAGQTVTWTYANLAPLARREFDVLFSLPTNTPLGTQLSSTASAPLAADLVPDDNTAAATQAVTSSFDPNDITVNYQRLTPAQVAAQLPLDYTIRFQNMGTDTAFTVVITDTLDFRKLNVASLMLVAQSHNCIWSLSGTGRLTVRFLNINLPYRNQDIIRSQGFVRFRVQPRTTLTVGEIIPNHASIVFDYNEPVITNTATTTVAQPTAALARHDAPAWTAYPNPATDAISLDADLATAGKVAIELLDVLGRPLRRQLLTAPAGPLRQLVDLHGLAAGVYLLRLTPPNGPATSRRVVIH